MEEWKVIKDFLDYSISNQGRVKSHKNGLTLIMQNKLIPSGYEQISFSQKNKKFYRYVHRLVAEAFIANPQNLPWVNHIDGNKTNNHVNNLEWVVPSENSKHAFKYGLSRINDQQRNAFIARTRSLLSRRVEQLTANGQIIRTWDNACEAQKELGFDRSNIAEACRKGLVRYGYRWRYISEPSLGKASV